MSNLRAALVRLCRTPDGWKRFPVVYGKNGRIKPGVVNVNGREEEFPVGRYQVRWYEGRKTTYRDVGDRPMEALAELRKQSQLLLARDASKAAGVTLKEEEAPQRLILARELERFVQTTRDRGSLVAAGLYNAAVREFIEVTGRTYADEVVLDDLARYQRALRARGCADRTIHNRHANVVAFLRWCKLDVKQLAPRRPRYEKTLPEIYSKEQLQKFFALPMDEKVRLAFEILLKCGLREQEAVYLEWGNVDLDRSVLRVRANPRYGFKVKDCEERDIPLPAELVERMRSFRGANPRQKLVTGTKTDHPNTKLLRTLKRLVRRGKLNCGECEGCLSTKECSRWYLHKFRATYITTLLRSGLDLRTVMKFSGHSDLESVMRYLAPAEDESVRQHVNAISWL